MKTLLRSIFFAFFLFVLIIPVSSPSNAHAASTIPPCTESSGYWHASITVQVNGGVNEDWECDFAYYFKNGVYSAYYSWVPKYIYPNPSYWTNLNANMEMDVYGNSTNNSAHIDQWPYNGQNNQRWSMAPYYSNGYGYFTVTSVNSGKCMGVQGASTAQGASVVQYTCNNSHDQSWLWVWTGSFTSDGWPIWNIVNENSGLCLGITEASQTAGTYAIQWDCNGNADQSWY
ncbi:RICIN domain-containing protein [Dictyobacter alpinus]|uniref:RICIN domain-containing protein n=1 Tax=Dictyobacter alpinus TaxID=2014873 RepID=UPI000F839238|nr:RICIN domain-containing protein [Dictyobacter alpinus]